MSIIPAPVQHEVLNGRFILPPDLLITHTVDGGLDSIAAHAAAALRSRYGTNVTVQSLPVPAEGVGLIHLSCQPSVGSLVEMPNMSEGYELTVSEGSVVIAGIAGRGIFYGLQSLLMLLPPLPPPQNQDIAIASVKVRFSVECAWWHVIG